MRSASANFTDAELAEAIDYAHARGRSRVCHGERPAAHVGIWRAASFYRVSVGNPRRRRDGIGYLRPVACPLTRAVARGPYFDAGERRLRRSMPGVAQTRRVARRSGAGIDARGDPRDPRGDTGRAGAGGVHPRLDVHRVQRTLPALELISRTRRQSRKMRAAVPLELRELTVTEEKRPNEPFEVIEDGGEYVRP